MMTPGLLDRALEGAPDPELARVTIGRLRERPPAGELLDRPPVLAAAAPLLGFSRAAADFFLAHPEELESLAELRRRSRRELGEEASFDVDRLGLEAGLRRFRRRASYRIAARDLRGAPVDEVMAELSDVAEACLRIAVEREPGGASMAVIGMGKLGGRELNYASDVDVLFVHAEAGGEAQQAASRAAGRVLGALSQPTADGVALRVDVNLRPEGRAGPLSRSLESMVDYYARRAQTWERQALLKARPVAGDSHLGERFVQSVAPFVFPSVLDSGAIEDVRSTKARIEERVRAAGKDAVELKRGRGGIRDVEFAVQLLQLVHGARYPSLRISGTLPALAGLAEEGFVGTGDAEVLADSYRFLRRLEHRLQMVRDLQTHELPVDPQALAPLARAMGLGDAGELGAEYGRHTAAVRGLYERLFFRPLLEAFSGATATPGLDRTATEELLAGLGFGDPSSAYGTFDRLIDSSRMGRVLRGLFPVIAPSLAFGARPDSALTRFERVVEGLRGEDRLADRLADRPDGARRVAMLVSVSSAFADMLVSRPQLVGSMTEASQVGATGPDGDDPRAELVCIAGAHAARELAVPETGRRLAALADRVIGQALSDAGATLPLAVIGLGKLGGEELSFASDLDIVFVYEGVGTDDFQRASRVAEAVLDAIRSGGWHADAALRPEGRSGPLARSLVSYLEYWERWAQTWEYQALLRARRVAGDEELGRRFLANAADFAYPDAITRDQVAAIRRMRVRMEEERIRPEAARRFHFKLGHGSLADVQFAVELSLMRHGAGFAEVRRTHTLDALEALVRVGALEESVARSLSEAYVFLMEVKNALEIEQRLPQEALPPTPEAQAALARRLGYREAARHRFLQEYRRLTHRARRAMERVFYGGDA
jgi:[glutamine synthetase] adenylyltransferase / [glutamine synthetase]-adenylyl-L-tyrosine phosphorylase